MCSYLVILLYVLLLRKLFAFATDATIKYKCRSQVLLHWMLLLLYVSLLSHVLLPLHVMQHLFQVVVAHVMVNAMVRILLHVTADTVVHMLLHSAGVLDACAAAVFDVVVACAVASHRTIDVTLLCVTAHCCCCCMCTCFCICCYHHVCFYTYLSKDTAFPFIAFGVIDVAHIVAHACIASFGWGCWCMCHC